MEIHLMVIVAVDPINQAEVNKFTTWNAMYHALIAVDQEDSRHSDHAYTQAQIEYKMLPLAEKKNIHMQIQNVEGCY
jgi:hypothetical protein